MQAIMKNVGMNKEVIMEKIIQIANQYRQDNKETYPFMLETGYVRLFDNKPYGWCADMGEASTERPTALLVGLDNSVFEAVGGNDKTGAKKWVKREFDNERTSTNK